MAPVTCPADRPNRPPRSDSAGNARSKHREGVPRTWVQFPPPPLKARLSGVWPQIGDLSVDRGHPEGVRHRDAMMSVAHEVPVAESEHRDRGEGPAAAGRHPEALPATAARGRWPEAVVERSGLSRLRRSHD